MLEELSRSSSPNEYLVESLECCAAFRNCCGCMGMIRCQPQSLLVETPQLIIRPHHRVLPPLRLVCLHDVLRILHDRLESTDDVAVNRREEFRRLR